MEFNFQAITPPMPPQERTDQKLNLQLAATSLASHTILAPPTMPVPTLNNKPDSSADGRYDEGAGPQGHLEYLCPYGCG